MDNKAYSSDGCVTFSTDKAKVNTQVLSKVRANKNKLYLVLFIISLLVLIFSIALLIIGATRNTSKSIKCSQVEKSDFKIGEIKNPLLLDDVCSYSAEAKLKRLNQFFKKVQTNYFKFLPEHLLLYPNVTDQMILDKFRFPDYRPNNLRKITKAANKLFGEAVAMNPDLSKLKPREHKAYLETKFFLQSNFGNPSLNYTSGIWLLGPTFICYEPICFLNSIIYHVLQKRKLRNKVDIDFLITHFKSFKRTILNYIKVLKYGIKSGMVRSQIECSAGTEAFKSRYRQVANHGAQGLKDEWYSRSFYTDEFYTNVQHLDSIPEYNLSVSKYVITALERNVGESINKLIKYFETEFYLHCRPDVGFGGLSALPLDFIYYNGSVTNKKTKPFLSGKKINTTESYIDLLAYHTSTDVHPKQLNEKGWKKVHEIYNEIVEVASQVTGQKNETTAVTEFKNVISKQENYFNAKPFPENESNANAFVSCFSINSAKLNCPKRWEAIKKWIFFSQSVLSLHDANTVHLFDFTGPKKTAPSCPVEIVPSFISSVKVQQYRKSDRSCSRTAKYYIPFFLQNYGPKYSEFTISAHEARPGHHTQSQGMVEMFSHDCNSAEDLIHKVSRYNAFLEGWGLYAENPLVAKDTNVYKDNLMQKYGMLKLQMFRALRLVIDTGLHYEGMTRQEALDLFKKYAWDESDVAKGEVTRYQSFIGQATSYMFGQLEIWKLRNKTEQALNQHFDLKEFHFQILSQGSGPLAFTKSHINRYIECKLDSTKPNCDAVLNPQNPLKQSRKNFHSMLFMQENLRNLL